MIHSPGTPPASTGSHLISGATRSATFSIPARIRSIDAFGFEGCDLRISSTLASCWLAIFFSPVAFRLSGVRSPKVVYNETGNFANAAACRILRLAAKHRAALKKLVEERHDRGRATLLMVTQNGEVTQHAYGKGTGHYSALERVLS